MSTFGEIQTKVSARLLDANNTAVSTSDVDAAINDSINYWKYRRFGFNSEVDYAAMTAQNAVIPLPSDFLVPFTDDDGFAIEYGQVRYPLVKLTTQQYDALYVANGYGLPRWYARIGDNYEVYPMPDQNYQVRRNYLKNYTPLTSAGQTNDFTDNASRLLVLWTCANLIAEFRQDEKMEAYFRSGANDEYKNLRVLSDKENGTGKLSLESTLLF